MVKIGNKTYIPLDGTHDIKYTRGGQVAVDDVVIEGRLSFEAGHPLCNPSGMCICVNAF